MLFIGQTQWELRIDCEFRYFDVSNDLSRAVSTEKEEKSLIKVGLGKNEMEKLEFTYIADGNIKCSSFIRI